MQVLCFSRVVFTLAVTLLVCAGKGRKLVSYSKGNDRCSTNNGGCAHTCSSLPGNSTCTCKDGFRLAPDGHDCVDEDECRANKGGCAQHCVNTLGSFECACNSGYSLDTSGKRCVFGEWCLVSLGCQHGCRPASTGNRVECYCRAGFVLHSDGKACGRSCELGNGGCHHVCSTTGDRSVCSCADGYTLNADNKTCRASCSVNNGGCERKCLDTKLGRVCSCPSGFKLHGDGHSCIDVDECEARTDRCSHLCENTKGAFECVCPAGYTISSDQKTCQDVDECLLNSTCDHTCVNLPGSFQCHCQLGYQLFGLTHCADINECSIRNGGCQHTCTNTQGSYSCSCDPGSKLHPNNHDCIDAAQCSSLVQQPHSVLKCIQLAANEQQCSITCTNQTQLTNQHGLINSSSVTFRCGSSTKFEWTNQEIDSMPQCSGAISAPSYSRTAWVVFLGDSCEVGQQQAEDIRANLTQIISNDKNYLCKNICHVSSVDLTCGSRRKKFRKLIRHNRKYLVTAEFVIQMSPLQITATCDVTCTAAKSMQVFYRTFQKFKRAVRQHKYSARFGGRELVPIKKSFKSDKRVKELCRDGMELFNNICIACSAGTLYNSKTKKCQPCQRGTFQDEGGQLSCKECPNTQPGAGVEGATTQSQCHEQCEPGTVSTSGKKPCTMCQIGTFQPNFGRTFCLQCGKGLRTRGNGSTSFRNCIAKIVCQPGHYYNVSNHSCSVCARGSYQPAAGKDLCLPCPGKTSTDFEGSISPADCKDRQCGRRIGDFFGVLESPNYPGDYPINIECIWKIQPEERRRVLFILPKIELGGEGCGDTIIMRKSQDPASQSTFETCESRDKPLAFTARSKKLWVQFKSNGNHTGGGFSIPFVTYNEEYESLIEDIVRDDRLYSTRQHQRIFQDRQLLTVLLEVIATPYNYLKYANVSYSMFPPSFFKLLTPKVRRFFET